MGVKNTWLWELLKSEYCSHLLLLKVVSTALSYFKANKTTVWKAQHFCFFVCLSLLFLGPHLWHMEVPRLGVTLELQLLAYATATATLDPSWVFDLCDSSCNVRSLTH